jgi:hypothetical protein
MGTVLTKVIMLTPPPSWMVMALLLGSIARAVTGTDSTAVHSHSLLTGLLWMLRVGRQGVACSRFAEFQVGCWAYEGGLEKKGATEESNARVDSFMNPGAELYCDKCHVL